MSRTRSLVSELSRFAVQKMAGAFVGRLKSLNLFRRGAVLLALMCTAASGQSLRCDTPQNFTLPDNDGAIQRPVWKRDSQIVFTSGLRVNTDGAANSYHPIGTSKGALNTICNAIAIKPLSGPYAGVRISSKFPNDGPNKLDGKVRCQMILDAFRRSMTADYAILPDVEIDWYALASRSPHAGKYRPCIQQTGEFKGFFVAQTARAADPLLDVCDPAHWISSTSIPYITLPGARLAEHGASPGDLALVHRRNNGAEVWVVAIAADTGNKNELGEGSIALHIALGQTWQGRIPGNIGDGVTTFLFPGRKAKSPVSRVSLEAQRGALMSALGKNAGWVNCKR